MRQIHFVAFLQAQNCTTLPASWRHPDARTDTYSPEYYQHIARVLEAGKCDIGFFDDRLAMPDMYGGDHAHTVQNGIRCVKMDPIVCLMTMAAATTRLGLGATYSTQYLSLTLTALRAEQLHQLAMEEYRSIHQQATYLLERAITEAITTRDRTRERDLEEYLEADHAAAP